MSQVCFNCCLFHVVCLYAFMCLLSVELASPLLPYQHFQCSALFVLAFQSTGRWRHVQGEQLPDAAGLRYPVAQSGRRQGAAPGRRRRLRQRLRDAEPGYGAQIHHHVHDWSKLRYFPCSGASWEFWTPDPSGGRSVVDEAHTIVTPLDPSEFSLDSTCRKGTFSKHGYKPSTCKQDSVQNGRVTIQLLKLKKSCLTQTCELADCNTEYRIHMLRKLQMIVNMPDKRRPGIAFLQCAEGVFSSCPRLFSLPVLKKA